MGSLGAYYEGLLYKGLKKRWGLSGASILRSLGGIGFRVQGWQLCRVLPTGAVDTACVGIEKA